MKKIFFIGSVFIAVVTLFGFNVFKEEEKTYYSHDLILVNIDGAVNIPGEYEVSVDTKLKDLIMYAGGLKNQAENKLIDEEEMLLNNNYYFIPYKEKENNEKETEGLININTATLEELITLPNIGNKKAQEIINYRNTNGHFKKKEDLMEVTGIGEKIYEELFKKITV